MRGENKENLDKQTHAETNKPVNKHTLVLRSVLAGALAAAALAIRFVEFFFFVGAKSWGRTALPNAALICFGNTTAVRSHEPLRELTARAGQGDSSVCLGAGTLQVMFSKALLNLMACKIT